MNILSYTRHATRRAALRLDRLWYTRPNQLRPAIRPDVLRPAIGALMPDQRIQEILTEISAVAINPRVRELITELGDILAEVASSEAKNTKDADERFKTVGVLYRRLRKEMRALERQIETRDHNVSAKIHQLSNHIMGFEQRLAEIADIVLPENEDISRANIVGSDDISFFGIEDDDTTAT